MPLSRDNRILLAFCSLTFLLAFQPSNAFRLLGTFDEVCYIRWLAYLLGIEHPGCFSEQMQAGIAAVWFPLGLLVRTAGFFFADFEYLFWLPVSVGVSSFLAYAASVFLIHKILEYEGISSVGTTLLTVLATPVLFYATQNTALAHAGELFLALVCFRFLQMHWWLAAMVTAALLTATRWNDAPVLLVAIAWMIEARNHPFAPRTKKLILIFAGLVGAVFLWKTYQVGFIRGYNSSSAPQMLRLASWLGVKRTFLASDWGLIYLNAPWCILLWLGMMHLDRLSAKGKAAVFWMLANAVLVVLWRGNGRYFGHRYLIGSYAGALLVFWELRPALRTIEFRWLKISAILSAIWIGTLGILYPAHWPWPKHDHYSEIALPFWSALTNLGSAAVTEYLCQSALGTSLLSLAARIGWLPMGSPFYRYTLQGSPLTVLILLSLLSVILLWFSARERRWGKSAEGAPDSVASIP